MKNCEKGFFKACSKFIGKAAKVGASTPLGAQTEALFQMFNGLGYGGKDFSAILQLLRGKLDELPK